MNVVYISKEDVIKSIEYFKELSVSSDDSLFIYLIAKHFGITTSYPITFKTSALNDEQKKEYRKALWMFAGLVDANEAPGKRTLIFPNSFKNNEIKKSDYYQPGTEFSQVTGRTKDTVEKKNINVPIYNDEDSVITLRHNYKEIISDEYLNGKKISLRHLASWLFRYTKFEFDSYPNEVEFSRVIEKFIYKYLKITKQDFQWLFEDDISINRIKPSKSAITGVEIRQNLSFESGMEPEVKPSGTCPDNSQVSSLSLEVVNQYLELKGDNPSDQTIFETLKLKKQIVINGVPGVGKSRYTKELCQNTFFKESKMVQFHANYSYEDFIGGETLGTSSNSNNTVTEVITRKGTFLEFIEKAKNDLENNYLFIIDELNRGNIAEIFGETILILDRGYTVTLAKKIDNIIEISIPENMYIVATMNTSDRNIAFLDLAIRRRFAFIELKTNYDFLSEMVSCDFSSYDFGNILKKINSRILETLKDKELLLGQSYFIPQKDSNNNYVWTQTTLQNQFNFVILPTLMEYSFNDKNAVYTIIGEQLADCILDIEDFYCAFNAEFSN